MTSAVWQPLYLSRENKADVGRQAHVHCEGFPITSKCQSLQIDSRMGVDQKENSRLKV